jgi:hypothetical protein
VEHPFAKNASNLAWLCWSSAISSPQSARDPVELGPHDVLELQSPGALLEPNGFIVGQVDGDGL